MVPRFGGFLKRFRCWESLCGADRKAVVELHQVLQAEVHTREAWTQGSVQRVASDARQLHIGSPRR